MTLYEERYGDFGLTLAVEKLAEHHGITLSGETKDITRRPEHKTGHSHCERTWTFLKWLDTAMRSLDFGMVY